MSSNIEQTIQELASQFVHGVLQAISSASLQELAALAEEGGPAPTRARKGKGRVTREGGGKRASERRVRRSSEDVNELAERVVDFVRQSGGDQAVSDIARGLGLETADITRPITLALRAGQLRKEGEKRLTRYFIEEGSKSRRKRSTG